MRGEGPTFVKIMRPSGLYMFDPISQICERIAGTETLIRCEEAECGAVFDDSHLGWYVALQHAELAHGYTGLIEAVP